MIRTTIAALAVSAAFASSACAETLTVEAGDFTRLDASAGTTVVFTPGPTSVVLDGDAKSFERIKIRVVDGELRVGRNNKSLKGGWFRPDVGEIVVRVSSPALEGVQVSSGARLEATGIEADGFEIEVSSGGFAEVSGTCVDLAAEVSSGGAIRADELVCETASASASSGGSAEVHASGEATARASSGASISFAGSPSRVDKRSSSGGSVRVR